MKLFSLLLLAFSGFSVIPCKHSAERPPVKKRVINGPVTGNERIRLQSAVAGLRSSIKAGHFCEHYCFLADMSIHSGKNRFFVYDLKSDTVLRAGLVAHGSGSETGSGTLKFSNEA